jgi:hypothetical protein
MSRYRLTAMRGAISMKGLIWIAFVVIVMVAVTLVNLMGPRVVSDDDPPERPSSESTPPTVPASAPAPSH